ncbi:hypothetical protein KKC59_03230 [bacterium]|nr:hypothetical protein [bacterium]
MKKLFVMVMFVMFSLTVVNLSFAQETMGKSVSGTIEQIDENGAFLVVDGQKIMTDKGFLEDSYLEVGELVKIDVQETADGFKAVDYEYIYDEGDTYSEEIPSIEE